MKARLQALVLAVAVAGSLAVPPARAQVRTSEASPSPAAAPVAPATSPSPAASPSPSSAEHPDGTDALAKASQNPVAPLISVPFQSNTGFGLSKRNATAELLKIQPVIPQSLGEWNLIHRTIVPVGYLPFTAITPVGLTPHSGGVFGLGDTTYTGFLSPARPSEFVWGAGPAITIPTASHRALGAGKWSVGPSAVFVSSKGPVVTGVLVQQQWSVGGEGARPDVSAGLIQPFFNYNFPKGWYFSSSPIINVNWNADRGQKWSIPVGGGMGRVFNIGRQAVNLTGQLYYYAVRPAGGPSWDLRLSFSLLFPTHRDK